MKRCRRCGAGPVGDCGYYGSEIPREQCPVAPVAVSSGITPPKPKIGDRVPAAPPPKLDVRPKSWSDSKAKGPRGVFQNGGNSR